MRPRACSGLGRRDASGGMGDGCKCLQIAPCKDGVGLVSRMIAVRRDTGLNEGGVWLQAATRLQLTSSWGGRSDWWGATRKIRGAHVVGFPATKCGVRGAVTLIHELGEPSLSRALTRTASGAPGERGTDGRMSDGVSDNGSGTAAVTRKEASAWGAVLVRMPNSATAVASPLPPAVMTRCAEPCRIAVGNGYQPVTS